MQKSLEWNRGFAFALLAFALVLLALGTAGLEGNLLRLPRPAGEAPANGGAAVDRYAELFATEPFTALLNPADRRDVFLTTHFNRATPPAAEPPKPKTRAVALTYLGTLSGSAGERSVFVRVDQQVWPLAAGGQVIEDWRIAEISSGALMLTNNAAQTSRLGFRQTVQIEVPIR